MEHPGYKGYPSGEAKARGRCIIESPVNGEERAHRRPGFVTRAPWAGPTLGE